jgi:hypothetical protein
MLTKDRPAHTKELKTCYQVLNDLLNKCVFSLTQKLNRELDDRMERDYSFQISGAVRERTTTFFLRARGTNNSSELSPERKL